MDFAVTPLMYIIVCPLIFLAGFIDAAAGGGGLISLPAYLAAGLPAHLAAGTNKLSASVGTVFSTATYLRNGKVELKSAALGIAGALPGAYLGAQLLMLVSADVVRWLLLIVAPAVAALMLLSKKGDAEDSVRHVWAALPIGFIVGMYDGFFGPGTGIFLTLLFRAAMKMGWVRASGTAKPINLASNVSSLLAFIIGGQVVFALAIPAAACSIAGNLLGARISIKKGATAVRVLLLVALGLLLIRVAYDLFL